MQKSACKRLITVGGVYEDGAAASFPMCMFPTCGILEGGTVDAPGPTFADRSTVTLKLSLFADIACAALSGSGPPLRTNCSIDFSVFRAVPTGRPCMASSRDFAAREKNSC
jgi:hypothetical protein